MKFTGKIAVLGLLALAKYQLAIAVPSVELKANMVIKSSVLIKKSTYFLKANSSNAPLITITGNNITIDFNNAILHGSNNKQFPNQFYGLAVLVKGNNITIKNAVIRGYKIALMADSCKNLKIEYSDFSYNYRQQLQSTWLREDVSDWMSYHHNENDEWLRYGAGIYLKDCGKPIIQYNTITGGQCALMMMRCNDGTIINNDFSFNSAIGIGMYRSSRNNILHNKLDFNVRGYSFGFYNRGQDSAGILVFEQCNDNVFAYNSVTHGGDGFFLWAGQTTMDNGKGGCNNNYLYKNNFSYAPTNGIEVTFSRNIITDNIINECDHGIWGGYSWQTSITGNQFYKNRIGIAIEHGQNNNISYNSFESNKTAGVKLWARKTQPADWGYAQKRDTKSHSYEFWENSFKNENTAFDFSLTNGISLFRNTYLNNKTDIKKDSSVTNLEINSDFASDTTSVIPLIINKWKEKNIPVINTPSGKDQIRITEWGPYDFRYPILFLKKIDSNNVYYFDLLGPKGNWKIKNSNDVTGITQNQGIFPTEISIQKTGEDVQIAMEFVGEKFTDQFGKAQPAGKPYVFSFRDYKPGITWNVNWYKWDALHDPNKDYIIFKDYLVKSTPLKIENTNKLNYTWWNEIGKNLPADSFVTIAATTINVKKGLYDLGVTADDLIKVFVDGKLVIDFWDAKKYVNDEDAHHNTIIQLNGKHDIRIEHVENAGYATLIFTLKPI
ncbi:right-handed parallel beta-helix repeat-containing protein [Ferruginibacter sp.]|nr:right-handed parallel beta-helix repeat-containing protein [Ferruginibacter sp.]